MSTLFMIRHGQASFGKSDYDWLSETGFSQARTLGNYLFKTGVKFDAVYSGTLRRQKKTAEEALISFRKRGERLPELVLNEAFNEFDSKAILENIIPEMLEEDSSLKIHVEKLHTDWKSFKTVFIGAMLRWTGDERERPRIESWSSFSNRVLSGIDLIKKTHVGGRKVFVFTSGGPIAAAVQRSLDLTNERAVRLSWYIANTSVTRFLYDRRRLSLAAFNTISHLETLQNSNLVTYQ